MELIATTETKLWKHEGSWFISREDSEMIMAPEMLAQMFLLSCGKLEELEKHFKEVKK